MVSSTMFAVIITCGAVAGAERVETTPSHGGRPYALQPASGGFVVAHWRFDAEPGKVTTDGEGLPDLTGHSTAVAFGGPMFRSVAGLAGLEFSAGDDRLFVKDSPEFALTGSLTLEATIRCDGLAPGSVLQNQIVFRGDDRPGLDPWFLAVSLDGRLMFHIQDEQNQYVELHSPQPLPVHRIVHIAGTLDEASKSMKLYIDGTLVAAGETNLRPMGPLDPDTLPGVGIGNVQSATYPEGFNGLIAEVRISSRALQPGEFLKSASSAAHGAGPGNNCFHAE